MRFLVVGAGAIGGYFGGRLVQKGADVTFLVREGRRRQIEKNGLVINSVHGDFQSKVRTITTDDVKTQPYDLILLSVKAYHLDQAIKDIIPFVHEHTLILPLLNGYKHYDVLMSTFGTENVLGGLCFIESTLDHDGRIIQTSARHDLIFGEWDGRISNRVEQVYEHMKDAGFTVQLSEEVQKEIWHKYIFISSMSGITTLMRSPIGPIFAVEEGRQTVKKLIAEIVSIARAVEAPLIDNIEESIYQTMKVLHEQMKSSMQRDMEKSLPIEADHLQGTLLQLGVEKGLTAQQLPILSTVYANLKVYELGLD